MEQLERNKAILKKYIPEAAVNNIAQWIYVFDFKLKIKKKRNSVYGDYRPPVNGNNHQITINHDLNRYAFLTTLIHEVAHLSAWKKYGNNIQSHGKEWKHEYRTLLTPFLNETVYPADVLSALKEYLVNPSASVCNDKKLFKTLNRYDIVQNGMVFLEDLPSGTTFRTTGNEIIVKGEKRRTRYLCTKISTGERYLFHGMAQVTPIATAIQAG